MLPISGSLLEDSVARGQLRSQVGDADNDALWFRLLTSPNNGRLEVSPTGQWSYQPGINFNGVDRATVRVFDGQAVSELALVLNVARLTILLKHCRLCYQPLRKMLLLPILRRAWGM